ncbi:hypothetical protein AOLI_G00031310 [Acnodon oligacanthus]
MLYRLTDVDVQYTVYTLAKWLYIFALYCISPTFHVILHKLLSVTSQVGTEAATLDMTCLHSSDMTCLHSSIHTCSWTLGTMEVF